MDIYYINIEEFLSKYGTDVLIPYIEKKNFLSEKRKIEYGIGRFLVKNTAEKFYKINNTEIIINNKKPEFLNKEIEFSLTHSKNFVMAVFDKYPCGIDLEFMKDVNLEKLSKRYNRYFKTKEDFFEFWTQKEAEIKLPNCAKKNSFVFNNTYIVTVTSIKKEHEPIECKNLLNYL